MARLGLLGDDDFRADAFEAEGSEVKIWGIEV
jgi:hypothetical protein